MALREARQSLRPHSRALNVSQQRMVHGAADVLVADRVAIRRRYYGWMKDGRFFLSQQPPDAPVRPSVSYDTIEEIKALLASRRRIEIYWWPPLPDKVNAEIQNGLRVEGRD